MSRHLDSRPIVHELDPDHPERTIDDLEAGHVRPSPELVVELARALGVPASYFYAAPRDET